MRFSFLDIRKYTDSAPHYEDSCSMVVSGVNDKDVNALRVFLQNETKKLPSFAWLMADSTTESYGYCEKCVKRSGKVGRPKTIVEGKKVGRHVHILGVSLTTETDLNRVRNDFKKNINRRKEKHPNLKQPKTKPCDSMNYIAYMTRQADHLYSSTNFDWEYFDFYMYDDKI